MPNLPRFYSTKQLPWKSGRVPVSPQMMRRPYEALAEAGETMGRTALHTANVFDQIKEREQAASDALQAIELERSIRTETEKIADGFKDRTDYENFDEEIETKINSLRDSLRPQKASPQLTIAYERTFNQQAFSLSTMVKAKKYDVMDKRGKIAFGDILDRAYTDYSETDDLRRREFIKNQLEIQGEILRSKNLIDPLWIDSKLRAFDTDAIQVASNLDDVKADKAIMANPAQALINLQDSRYLPNLLPKQRQDKIEKANAAYKIFQNENEAKIKAAQKEEHDKEEKEIGNLFMALNYKDAYVMAYQSKFLSGDEKRVWSNAIEEKAKKKEPDEDDPAEFYNQLQKVIDPNLTDATKQSIANSIIQSSGLKDSTKKSLITDLLKSKEDQEIFNDPWFKFSERSIKEALGWTEMMGFFNLKNPQEAQSSYRDVVRQLILDIKKDKLKGEEIDKRGRQLVLPHQMKIWELLMGPKKEEKGFKWSWQKEKKAEEKYNIGQIYTDKDGKKAKYLGGGKWQPMK